MVEDGCEAAYQEISQSLFQGRIRMGLNYTVCGKPQAVLQPVSHRA